MQESKQEKMERRERALQLAIAAAKDEKVFKTRLIEDAAAIVKFIEEG